MRFEFAIPVPALLPNLNSRMHWAKQRRLTTDLKNVAWGHGINARVRAGQPSARTYLPLQQRHVYLTLVRGPGQKLMDLDNAIGSLKPILDGLTLAGWVVDDKAEWCQLEVRQARGPVRQVAVVVEWERKIPL